jgi:hypothetical protein
MPTWPSAANCLKTDSVAEGNMALFAEGQCPTADYWSGAKAPNSGGTVFQPREGFSRLLSRQE